jgi:hypothetical protein
MTVISKHFALCSEIQARLAADRRDGSTPRTLAVWLIREDLMRIKAFQWGRRFSRVVNEAEPEFLRHAKGLNVQHDGHAAQNSAFGLALLMLRRWAARAC